MNVESRPEYVPGDPTLIRDIISQLKSQGVFDQFRKECISDVDTKPAYQNLCHRVDGQVSSYLSDIRWGPDLNKNQLRENIRKFVNECTFVEPGIARIVDQLVNPRINTVLVPKVEDIVCQYIGIPPIERRLSSEPSRRLSVNVKLDDQHLSCESSKLSHSEKRNRENEPSQLRSPSKSYDEYNYPKKDILSVSSSPFNLKTECRDEVENKDSKHNFHSERAENDDSRAYSTIDSEEDNLNEDDVEEPSPSFEELTKTDVSSSGDAESDYSSEFVDTKNTNQHDVSDCDVKPASSCVEERHIENNEILPPVSADCLSQTDPAEVCNGPGKTASVQLDVPKTPTINYETSEDSDDNNYCRLSATNHPQSDLSPPGHDRATSSPCDMPDFSSVDKIAEKIAEDNRDPMKLSGANGGNEVIAARLNGGGHDVVESAAKVVREEKSDRHHHKDGGAIEKDASSSSRSTDGGATTNATAAKDSRHRDRKHSEQHRKEKHKSEHKRDGSKDDRDRKNSHREKERSTHDSGCRSKSSSKSHSENRDKSRKSSDEKEVLAEDDASSKSSKSREEHKSSSSHRSHDERKSRRDRDEKKHKSSGSGGNSASGDKRSSKDERSKEKRSKSDDAAAKDDRKKSKHEGDRSKEAKKSSSQADDEKTKSKKTEGSETKKSGGGGGGNKSQCSSDEKKTRTDRRSSDRDSNGPSTASSNHSHHRSSSKSDKEKHADKSRHSSSSSLSSSSHKSKKNDSIKTSGSADRPHQKEGCEHFTFAAVKYKDAPHREKRKDEATTQLSILEEEQALKSVRSEDAEAKNSLKDEQKRKSPDGSSPCPVAVKRQSFAESSPQELVDACGMPSIDGAKISVKSQPGESTAAGVAFGIKKPKIVRNESEFGKVVKLRKEYKEKMRLLQQQGKENANYVGDGVRAESDDKRMLERLSAPGGTLKETSVVSNTNKNGACKEIKLSITRIDSSYTIVNGSCFLSDGRSGYEYHRACPADVEKTVILSETDSKKATTFKIKPSSGCVAATGEKPENTFKIKICRSVSPSSGKERTKCVQSPALEMAEAARINTVSSPPVFYPPSEHDDEMGLEEEEAEEHMNDEELLRKMNIEEIIGCRADCTRISYDSSRFNHEKSGENGGSNIDAKASGLANGDASSATLAATTNSGECAPAHDVVATNSSTMVDGETTKSSASEAAVGAPTQNRPRPDENVKNDSAGEDDAANSCPAPDANAVMPVDENKKAENMDGEADTANHNDACEPKSPECRYFEPSASSNDEFAKFVEGLMRECGAAPPSSTSLSTNFSIQLNYPPEYDVIFRTQLGATVTRNSCVQNRPLGSQNIRTVAEAWATPVARHEPDAINDALTRNELKPSNAVGKSTSLSSSAVAAAVHEDTYESSQRSRVAVEEPKNRATNASKRKTLGIKRKISGPSRNAVLPISKIWESSSEGSLPNFQRVPDVTGGGVERILKKKSKIMSSASLAADNTISENISRLGVVDVVEGRPAKVAQENDNKRISTICNNNALESSSYSVPAKPPKKSRKNSPATPADELSPTETFPKRTPYKNKCYYDSSDLYKPRPSFLASSRRSRALNPESK